MEFVALLEGALILKSADTFEFYLCLFDADQIDGDGESSLPVAKLMMPFQSPTGFIPFYYDDVAGKISVSVSNAE